MEKIDKYCNEELYRETADELDVHIDLVKDVVNVQSEFTKKIIKKGFFESIRYVYLGAIKPRHKKIQKMNDMQGKQFNI